MAVIQDYEDRYGNTCFAFPKSYTPGEIYDWLWGNGFQDYRFVIMINTDGGEYDTPDFTLVYFADTVLEEQAFYYDYELKKRGCRL